MTTAALTFGWIFPPNHDFPWHLIEDEHGNPLALDLDSWWRYIHKQPVKIVGLSLEQIEEVHQWEDQNPTPVEWTSCVNSDDEIQEILYVRDYILSTEDPMIVIPDNELVVLPTDLAKAQEFIRKYDITGGQGPSWWLTCDYF